MDQALALPQGASTRNKATDQVVFRAAELQDAIALCAIEAQCFETDRLSLRSFRRLIRRKTARTLVAEVDGEAAGYAMVLFRCNSAVARLYSIAVDPGHKQSGIGRGLLSAAEAAARGAQCLFLRLEVRADNRHAISMYEKAGYRRIGTVEAYYADGVAALRLEKKLHGSATSLTAPQHIHQSFDFTCGPATS